MTTIFCVRPKGFNIGNDAIFVGLQEFLLAAFGRTVNVVVIPATSRFESEAKGGLTSQTVHEINQYGHGVIVGGGNAYENGGLDVELNALGALEVPLMLFSLSRGRIYNSRRQLVDRTDVMPDGVIRALNQKAMVSVARDLATFAYLTNLGLDDVVLGGCPTLFLDRVEDRLPVLPEGEKVGALISVRNPQLMNIPLDVRAKVFGDVERAIGLLEGRGHRVRLLCHDHRDLEFAASFRGIDYVYAPDVFHYLALLRACDLSISYRLHAAIPCLAFGIPFVKVTYDERAKSLMETVGLGGWDIDMLERDDVASEIDSRLDSLAELARLRDVARSTHWESLGDAMSSAFSRFASAVSAYEEGGDR